MLYREACDARTPWDCELPKELKSRWESWEGGLPEKSSGVKKPCQTPRENPKHQPPHFRRCQRQGRISSNILSHTSTIWRNPRSGSCKLQACEERVDITKARTYGNQSRAQRESCSTRVPNNKGPLLAWQQRCSSLDQRGWKLQTVTTSVEAVFKETIQSTCLTTRCSVGSWLCKLTHKLPRGS